MLSTILILKCANKINLKYRARIKFNTTVSNEIPYPCCRFCCEKMESEEDDSESP